MKHLLLSLTFLSAAQAASGQAITISTFKPIAPFTIDSCAVPTPAALAALPSLGTPATNNSWDLGGVAVQNTFAVYAYQPKTSGFTTATYSDSVSYRLSSSSLTSYKAWRNIQQASTGVFIQGEEVLTRQARGLGSMTGNNIDSIVFPTQVLNYNSTPLRIIKFPATIGTVWIDSTARNLSFNLTVTAASLNNTPCQQRQKRLSIDSVVGWGSMKVPIVGKTKSTAIPVLQIHHYDIYIDSFFVNNAPAPAAMLTMLGASQGQSTTVSRTFFYRANATRPLIEMVHSTPSHSSSASLFYIHAADLVEATAVPLTQTSSIRCYPNPVAAGGTMQLQLPLGGAGNWHYSLLNAMGQVVAQAALPVDAQSGKASFRMPEGLAAGTYCLNLQQTGEATALMVTVR